MPAVIHENLAIGDLAYMAGIIDGEGSICIVNARSKAGYSKPTPKISISNTDPRLMEWVHSRFGGRVCPVKRRRNEELRWKQCYHWDTGHRNAAKVIEAVLPFLIIKREQAELWLAFQRTMKRRGKGVAGGLGTPDNIIGFRDELVRKISGLNSRGPSQLSRFS